MREPLDNSVVSFFMTRARKTRGEFCWRWLITGLVAVLLILAAPAGLAQSTSQSNAEFERLNERVTELRHAGKFTEAIPLAEQRLALAAKRFGENHPNYATALNILALLYKSQGRYGERMAALDAQMKEIDERLAKEFPTNGELVQGKPASIADTQKALRPDEALAAFSFGDDEAYLFVLRKGVAKFLSLPAKRADIAALVAQLRDALDPKGRKFDKMPSFDAATAHDLYQKLFGPVDEMIRDAAHLIVVADGPLQSLPPSLLVTEAFKQPISAPADYRHYRDVAWLIRRQAVTVIPAVSSLVSLRKYAEAGHANKPFTGFGDPDFG